MTNKLIYKFLIAVAAICLASSAKAQKMDYNSILTPQTKARTSSEMGIIIGAGYMFATPRIDEITLNPKLGVRGGLAMSLCWHDSYALQLEVAYAYNKIDAQRDGGKEYSVKGGALEIPIIFSYRRLWPLRFNLGGVLSVAGIGRYDLPTERIEFGRLRPTLGYMAGVGVNLSRNLILDARYTGSFVDTMNYLDGDVFAMRGHWLTLSLGYMF